jgi:uncharacterized protein with von Willebrand factor type A (vWA) domain
MFVTFFHALKRAGLPVSLKEYLTLLEGLDAGVTGRQVDDFYFLSRACLVKDERNLDRFDRVFGEVFKGIAALPDAIEAEIPEEWLRLVSALHLSDEDKARIEELGGWEKIMETLKKRLAEQKDRHAGGNKWIGTGGTSPFGHSGYNPEGIRVGGESKNKSAVKVWDRRDFKNLDDQVELGTRNIKVALRRLRKFARVGAAEELDLDGTIRQTARSGYLDVKLRPERRNAVKVLLFLDVGGSMDWHIAQCEELFSAARSEFKYLEHFYFHNCVYETVWRSNARRSSERIPLENVLHTYSSDYKLIFVGDASMGPYEVLYANGSVEHNNPEPGKAWLGRLLATYPRAVWLNPVQENHWSYTDSIRLIGHIMEHRMFPLTVEGIDAAMRELT